MERSVEKIARTLEEICRFEMPIPAGSADAAPADEQEGTR